MDYQATIQFVTDLVSDYRQAVDQEDDEAVKEFRAQIAEIQNIIDHVFN